MLSTKLPKYVVNVIAEVYCLILCTDILLRILHSKSRCTYHALVSVVV